MREAAELQNPSEKPAFARLGHSRHGTEGRKSLFAFANDVYEYIQGRLELRWQTDYLATLELPFSLKSRTSREA